MSLDKAIQHGKEKRKPYYGCKSFDPACRNYGSDTYSTKGRLHNRTKAEQQADAKIKEAETEPSITNREWLESLSDEELAETILGAFKVFIMVDKTIGTRENDSRAESLRKHIKWLRAEHKK